MLRLFHHQSRAIALLTLRVCAVALIALLLGAASSFRSALGSPTGHRPTGKPSSAWPALVDSREASEVAASGQRAAPAGSLLLRNTSSADVRVEVRMGTNAPCGEGSGTVVVLRPGKSWQLVGTRAICWRRDGAGPGAADWSPWRRILLKPSDRVETPL